MNDNSNYEGQILYIRHGNTDYNILFENKEDKSILFNEKYQDTCLNEKGRNQSLELSKILTDFNIKYVFCSPLLRAIQTIQIALEDHKNRKTMRFYLHPLLNETLSGTCDFSKNMEIKKKSVNEYCTNEDCLKYLDEFCKENNISDEIFYLKFLDSDLIDQEVCKDLIYKITSNKQEGMIGNLVKELTDTKTCNKPENYNGTFRRVKEFKEFLKKFLENNKLEKNEVVCVISHSAFIRLSRSKEAYDIPDLRAYPKDAKKLDNCGIINLSI